MNRITDGLYGSFNCMLYDDQHPTPRVLRNPRLPPLAPEDAAADAAANGGAAAAHQGAAARQHVSAVWGPTCDSADCVYKTCLLPELRVGDCLVFPNAGAYTVAGACDFNGLPLTAPRRVFLASAAPAPTA